MAASIEELIAAISEGPSERLGEIERMANSLADDAISERESTLPRGSAVKSAPTRFASRLHQARILSLVTAENARRNPEAVVAVNRLLAEMGDASTFRVVSALLQNSDIPLPAMQSCLSVFRVIGGPIAEQVLKSVATRSSQLQRLASWHLNELQSGGTIDIAEGTTRYGKENLHQEPLHAETSPLAHKLASLVQLGWNGEVLSYEFESELDPGVYRAKYAVYLEAYRCRLLEQIEAAPLRLENPLRVELAKSVEQLWQAKPEGGEFFGQVFQQVATQLKPFPSLIRPEIDRAINDLVGNDRVIDELQEVTERTEKGLRQKIANFREEVSATRETVDFNESLEDRVAEHCQAGLELTQYFGMPEHRWASALVTEAAIDEFVALINMLQGLQSRMPQVWHYISHLEKRAELLKALQIRQDAIISMLAT